MINFAAVLEAKEKTHAYVNGTKAYHAGESNEAPYPEDSKEWSEWMDGFLDARWVAHGV